MSREPKIEKIERMHAPGYSALAVSIYSRSAARGKAAAAELPKSMTTREGMIQQNKSRVGRLRAQLKTETNVQLRLRIMRELQERSASQSLIGTPERPC
jgi:hypothetical protein